jgi:hypothetical protein
MIERFTNRRTITRATPPGRAMPPGRAIAHSHSSTPSRSNRLALALAIALGAALVLLYAGAARSETIATGDAVMVRASDIARPSRGMTMHTVEAKFGAPQQRHAAVGEPPISRWDYQGFTVFFERDRVIHAVVDPAS